MWGVLHTNIDEMVFKTCVLLYYAMFYSSLIFRMLRLKVVLLAFLVSSMLTTGEAGRQRRATSKSKSKERKNVAKLGPEGKNCLAGGKLVCHKDIKTKFSSTLAV